MFGKRVSWLAAACLAAAVLAGGCGDDDAGVGIDVTGGWKCSAEGMGGAFAYLEQAGGDVTGIIGDMVISGTASGGTVSLILGDEASGDYMAGNLTTAGPDTLVGSFDAYEGDVLVGSASGIMERFTPSGAFAASGTHGGQAVSIDTTDLACGLVEDDGSEVSCRVSYLESADYVAEMLFHPGSSVLGVGTFNNLGTDIIVEFRVATQAGCVSDHAVSGTVTVSKFDASGFTGTFDITLNGGGTLTGSFDVPWDIISGTPF